MWLLLNLMFCEWNKDLLKGWSCNFKVNDILFLKLHMAYGFENTADSSNLFELNALVNIILEFINNLTIYNIICLNHVLVNKIWKILTDILTNLLGVLNCFKGNLISFTVWRFQMTWTSINNKSSINHNGNLVTKRFSLIHSVCS